MQTPLLGVGEGGVGSVEETIMALVVGVANGSVVTGGAVLCGVEVRSSGFNV